MTRHPDADNADLLVVRNDLSELARVGAWINAWAQRHGVPARTIERVDLCSTEVVTNIISYGYTDCATHQISLRLDRRGDGVALEIGDDGNAFDPRQADEPQPAANLEDAKIGGWGIQIVRRFSDELRYDRHGNQNRLTLIFTDCQ